MKKTPLKFTVYFFAFIALSVGFSRLALRSSLSGTTAGTLKTDAQSRSGNFAASLKKDRTEYQTLSSQFEALTQNTSELGAKLKLMAANIKKKETLLAVAPELSTELSTRSDAEMNRYLGVAEAIQNFNSSTRINLARLAFKGDEALVYVNGDALFRQVESPEGLKSSVTRSLDSLIENLNRSQAFKSLVIYQDPKSRGRYMERSRLRNLHQYFESKFGQNFESVSFLMNADTKVQIDGKSPVFLVELQLGKAHELVGGQTTPPRSETAKLR